MPPRRKAVRPAVDPTQTRQTRSRAKNLQTTPAEPYSDAGHLEIRKAMSSAPKQNAARKRGPWGEDYLLTNPKSALVRADLVKLFSNPKAWECLEEEEKRELLSLLPGHIHPNPDPDPDNPDAKIPPLPERFLRYDNNWRAALRHFQNDLESGRYKPEWQRQARQAVRERAEGKFDDFKEREFEQFWGQKQKINHGVIAGESSKVKLETLVQHGMVQVGDVWKYSRVFGLKNSQSAQVVVEKEAKITAIDGATLSFLIPVGQRVFLSTAGKPAKDPEDGMKETVTNNARVVIESGPIVHENKQAMLDSHDQPTITTEFVENSDHTSKPDPDAETQIKDEPQAAEDSSTTEQQILQVAPDDHQEPVTKRRRGRPRKRKAPDEGLPSSAAIETADTEPPPTIENNTCPDPKQGLKPEEEKDSNEPPLPAADSSLMDVDSAEANEQEPGETEKPEPEKNATLSPMCLETEIHNIAGPSALAKKILEFDGRITNPPNGNAWKEFRCLRNNQDMGSLWDLRQACYVRFQQD